jgi:hypothetical protein
LLPATIAGLVFFAASVCPGYWWVRVVEERKPRRERTQLLEAAELLTVGGLATSITVLGGLLAAEHIHVIDVKRLFADPRQYASDHPTLVLSAGLAVLVVANVGAWASAKVVYAKHPPVIRLGESATYLAAVTKRPPDSRSYLRVVQNDGTVLRGPYFSTTVDAGPPETQEVVLAVRDAFPLEVQPANGDVFESASGHCVVINGATIAATYVTYYVPPGSTA